MANCQSKLKFIVCLGRCTAKYDPVCRPQWRYGLKFRQTGDNAMIAMVYAHTNVNIIYLIRNNI